MAQDATRGDRGSVKWAGKREFLRVKKGSAAKSMIKNPFQENKKGKGNRTGRDQLGWEKNRIGTTQAYKEIKETAPDSANVCKGTEERGPVLGRTPVVTQQYASNLPSGWTFVRTYEGRSEEKGNRFAAQGAEVKVPWGLNVPRGKLKKKAAQMNVYEHNVTVEHTKRKKLVRPWRGESPAWDGFRHARV